MACPHCSANNVGNRSRLTRHGYKTFFCKNCKRTFNERTDTPFNRCQVQTAVLFKVILWRLRYKLSFGDLAEMFAVEVEHFYFTREAIRQWEAKFASLITHELKTERHGKNTNRWRVDETLVKVNKKYHYLYRAIDSHGHLVATKLSEVRTLESTTTFLEQAVQTTRQKPTQLTTDKDATYPGSIEKVVGKKLNIARFATLIIAWNARQEISF